MKAEYLLFYVVVGRRSDPSASAGLQQQPVLLWRLNPRTTGDGETGQLLHPPHPQLLFYAKIQFIFSLFFLQDPLEQKYPNVSVQALSLMKVKITKIHSQIISAISVELYQHLRLIFQEVEDYK